MKDFMPVNYLKKTSFTGSHNGMRFRMEKTENQDGAASLSVTAWPEPYGYDATPEVKKIRTLLSFDADGIARGVDWLNQQFAADPNRWKQAAGDTGYGKH